jgi:NAD dependent epimerase/dehydratase family enzyme
MVFLLQMDVAKMTIDENAVLKADFIIHLAGENTEKKDGQPNEKLKLSIVESSINCCIRC